jgi:hypothetical protein
VLTACSVRSGELRFASQLRGPDRSKLAVPDQDALNAPDSRDRSRRQYQDTHDRHYVLPDERVRAEAVEVIAAGAAEQPS